MQVSAISLVLHSCILLLHWPAADAVPLIEFYPHGFSENDGILQHSTDSGASYHTVQLTQAVSFYGNLYNSITVRNTMIDHEYGVKQLG